MFTYLYSLLKLIINYINPYNYFTKNKEIEPIPTYTYSRINHLDYILKSSQGIDNN
jgi:hypothetical protein